MILYLDPQGPGTLAVQVFIMYNFSQSIFFYVNLLNSNYMRNFLLRLGAWLFELFSRVTLSAIYLIVSGSFVSNGVYNGDFL